MFSRLNHTAFKGPGQPEAASHCVYQEILMAGTAGHSHWQEVDPSSGAAAAGARVPHNLPWDDLKMVDQTIADYFVDGELTHYSLYEP